MGCMILNPINGFSFKFFEASLGFTATHMVVNLNLMATANNHLNGLAIRLGGDSPNPVHIHILRQIHVSLHLN